MLEEMEFVSQTLNLFVGPPQSPTLYVGFAYGPEQLGDLFWIIFRHTM